MLPWQNTQKSKMHKRRQSLLWAMMQLTQAEPGQATTKVQETAGLGYPSQHDSLSNTQYL
jgi:hypothetical protein